MAYTMSYTETNTGETSKHVFKNKNDLIDWLITMHNMSSMDEIEMEA